MELLLPRLELKARSLQRKVVARRIRGAPVIGVEVEDLVQHARLCLLGGHPPFDPNLHSLIRYLFRRMEDLVRNVIRDRAENNANAYYPIDDDTGAPIENVVPLHDVRLASEIEADNYIKRFVEWLGRTHPDLEPLASVAIYHGCEECPDQAAALGLPIQRVYQLRERLREAVATFGLLVNAEMDK